MSINSVSLVGRVGQSPEVKYFESGTTKARFSLAVTRNRNQTDWFTIEAWGKTAEIVNQYVQKGKQIAISGRLKFDTWNDRNTGVARTAPVINAQSVELLGGAGSGNGNGYENQQQGYANQNGGYPPQQQNGYANQQQRYTNQQNGGGYPPQQQSEYPMPDTAVMDHF